MGWPESPNRGEGKSLEQVLQDYPDLLAIIDATEQPIERPADNARQKAHYSGKKKRPTRRTQTIVNEHGEIRAVSSSTPGSVHDFGLFRQSGSSEIIPAEVTAGGDAGHSGLHDESPDHSVFVPHKATRNPPLMVD